MSTSPRRQSTNELMTLVMVPDVELKLFASSSHSFLVTDSLHACNRS